MKKDATGMVRIAENLERSLNNLSIETKGCDHIYQVKDVSPSADGCDDCLKIGDEWVHLRLCLACGYVGCCDNSKNKHATNHYRETHHPLIVSYEENETWLWCYADEVLIKP